MVSYHSDDSFDNMYIDDNIRNLWKFDNDYEKLTPLRNWEKAEKYQVSKDIKLNKKELLKVGMLLLPSLFFIALSACIMLADYSLASFLDLLQDKGMSNQGVAVLGLIKMLKIDHISYILKHGPLYIWTELLSIFFCDLLT